MVAAAVAGHLAIATPPASAASIGGARLEAEQMDGAAEFVSDPTTTGGRAVVVRSERHVASGVQAGTYRLTARLHDGWGRVRLTVDGQRVIDTATGGTWRDISAIVRIDGPTQLVGVQPVVINPRRAPGPVGIDWVSLTPVAPAFTTRGNRVLDATGRPVTLRGVVREGMQASATGYRMSDTDIEAMRLWGASVVRIKLSQHFWLPSMCTYDPLYAKRVDAVVDSVTRRGMYAMLELARSTEGKTCGPARLFKMADRLSVDFWRDVATRYKANPLVGFDLYNEPNRITPTEWRDGATIDGVKIVGMQELYNTVRSTGATNLVFVSGNQYAYGVNVLLSHPLDAYGIVAAPHTYCPACSGGDLRPSIDSVVGVVVPEFPVVITEFGKAVASGAYNASLIKWAEERGIGWVAFQWSAWAPEAFGLLDSWNNYAPNVAGRPVRDALWQARGWTTYGGV